MGKPISIGQSHSLVQALANNIDWSKIDSETAQSIIDHPNEAQITAFINNRGKLIVGGDVLKLDRTKPFDLEKFIGKGWSIWKGPASGDGLTGEEDQDPRSFVLSEINIAKIRLQSGLIGEEKVVGGEEFVRRMRTGTNIPLDACVFQAFWENQHLVPEMFKQKTNGNTTFVFFPGTVLRSPDGRRYILYLYVKDGTLNWSFHYLGNDWDDNGPGAVLA